MERSTESPALFHSPLMEIAEQSAERMPGHAAFTASGTLLCRSQEKLYNDNVHGHVYLPRYCFSWIDTPEFQRLRRIKQLGTAQFVYEGEYHPRVTVQVRRIHALATVLAYRTLQIAW